MLGLLGNICLAFLFFPVTRGSSVLRLIGLTSESSIKYHIWLGHTTMVLFTAHGLGYTIFWARTHQLTQVRQAPYDSSSILNLWDCWELMHLLQMLKWETIGISNIAGELGLLTGIAIWLTSVPCIRRKIFELFYYTHHLYILFVVFFILHVGFSYCWITLPGFYLFLIDRLLRFLQSQQMVRVVSARVLPCKAVELNFSKTSGKLQKRYSCMGWYGWCLPVWLTQNTLPPKNIYFVKIDRLSSVITNNIFFQTMYIQ